jgi:hypothetical protein
VTHPPKAEQPAPAPATEPEAAPVLVLVDPNSGAQGDSMQVTIVGAGTHFASSSTVSFSGSGLAASNVVASDKLNLTATVAIDSVAALGQLDVMVTTGGEVATLAGGFTVIGTNDKAEILREAVNSYLRQNHVVEPALSICKEFIGSINQQMRPQGDKTPRVAVVIQECK